MMFVSGVLAAVVVVLAILLMLAVIPMTPVTVGGMFLATLGAGSVVAHKVYVVG